MVLQPVRVAFLVGLVVATAASAARADHAAPCAAPCGPTYRTVTVTECVPEHYTTTRTAYRYECKPETYTAYRHECVPETRTRVCTHVRYVSEVRNEVRTVCKYVSSCEDRTVMRPSYSYVNETCMVTKRVDRGHWECQEVYSHRKAFMNKLRSCCHKDDCCEPCLPPPTKTVKCWVPCIVCEQCPVTVCKKVCTMVPCTIKVTVCHPVTHQETYQVCCQRPVCEQRTETYCCYVSRCVPYQCTREVRVCVPYQETVQCCRMVSRCVTRQVPCDDCCHTSCCDNGHHRNRFSFAGLRGRNHGSCNSNHGCCD